MGQVFILGSIGFYILKRGILGQCCLRTISNLVVDVTLPCFVFTNILMNFHLVKNERWYLFPVYCLALFAAAGGAAWGVASLDRGMVRKKEFISLVTFQNSGFLPIILIGTLLPAAAAGRMYVYVFLFLLAYNPVLFTLGESIYSQSGGRHINWKNFFNPSSVATVASLALALAGWEKDVPKVVFEPMKMLGNTTIPLSMVVIGGIVTVNFSSKKKFPAVYALKASVLKLVLIPVAVYFALSLLRMQPEAKYIIVLEAMMPPATMLPLLAEKYDGDYELTGQMLFWITLLSLVTAPVLMSLLKVTLAAG